MNESVKTWHAIDVIVSADAREAVEYGLMEAGAIGTESSADERTVIWVRSYFETATSVEKAREALFEAFRIYNLAPSSLLEVKSSEITDRDWLAEWKKDWKPVEVGRFIIAPRWLLTEPLAVASGLGSEPLAVASGLGSERPAVASGSASGRIVIRINPGMAFGTGTHETTRLCLKAIEKYFRGGSFLDVGTGTGILAIAAAKMFSDARVQALDTDADAIAIARENALLNDVADRITFNVASITEQTSSADLVCANLTAPMIVELLPLLLGVTCGRLVLSGILDSQTELVQSRLFQLGAPIVDMEADGEWLVLVI